MVILICIVLLETTKINHLMVLFHHTLDKSLTLCQANVTLPNAILDLTIK